MNTIKYISVLFLVSVMASSCAIRFDKKKVLEQIAFEKAHTVIGNETYIRRDTIVPPFKYLDISSNIPDVELIQDDSCYISIYGPDNVVPIVRTDWSDDRINIGFIRDGGYIKNIDDMKIIVHVKSLNFISIAGSTDFKCSKYDMEEPLDVSVVGSADVDFGSLAGTDVSFNLAGSGDLDIRKLKATCLKVMLVGSADTDIKDIAVNKADVSVAGSGEIYLCGTAESASYSVSGSGDIDAKNVTCKSADVSVSGSGSIKYRDSEGKAITKEK